MLKKFMFLLPVCASVTSGCMSTPPLSEATGAEQSNIFIRDVVQRVKCELSDAFDQKVEQRDFLWLASWTAHADLTLVINDNAGISPSGSYTKYTRSAVNTDAGVGASKVLQLFSLGAGANLSGQAVRTETLSFTIALDELKRWREHINKVEANYPPEKKSCNFDSSMGVTGNLGLKEWVDSAFYPVEANHQLQAGIHPAQGASKGPSTQGPKSAPAVLKGQALPPSKEQIENDAKAWQKYLTGLQNNTKASNTTADDATNKIDTADADVKNKLKALTDSKFEPVLAPYLLERFARYKDIEEYTQAHKKAEENCSNFKTDVDNALKEVQELTADLKSNDPIDGLRVTYADVSGKIDGIKFNDDPAGNYAKKTARCASDLTLLADQAVKNDNTLPSQIDPPIDAVSHSLQFVVAYGANITPSWTLIQWKGPGMTQNFASASGTRTHTLDLALAPRTGGPAIGSDALRLIQNQVVRSTAN